MSSFGRANRQGLTRRPGNFWVMVIAGLCGGGWLMFALISDAAVVVAQEGIGRLPFDPTFQHKVGELLVAVPLFLAALFSSIRPKGWIAHNLLLSWPVTIVGGALNAMAWMGTADTAPWNEPNRLWFMLLAVIGLVGPTAIRALLNREKSRT